jgi:hypothetical protein
MTTAAQTNTTTEVFLAEWHRIVQEKNVTAIGALLAEDVTLGAPPYWSKLQGRPLVAHLLGLILQTIEDFTYQRQWVTGRELALEFTGHVGGKHLQGIDLITLDEAGHVANLDVLMRPINGIAALRDTIAPRMQEFLARLATPS